MDARLGNGGRSNSQSSLTLNKFITKAVHKPKRRIKGQRRRPEAAYPFVRDSPMNLEVSSTVSDKTSGNTRTNTRKEVDELLNQKLLSSGKRHHISPILENRESYVNKPTEGIKNR